MTTCMTVFAGTTKDGGTNNMKGKKRTSCGWAFERVVSDNPYMMTIHKRKELAKWWRRHKNDTYNPDKYGLQASRHPKIFGSFLYGNYVKPAFALGAK